MPPRQITDPSSRLAELEKDNSYMVIAPGGSSADMLSGLLGRVGGVGGGGGVSASGSGGAAANNGSSGSGANATADPRRARIHMGRASAQQEKLFQDSLKVYRKVTQKARDKERAQRRDSAKGSSSGAGGKKGGGAAKRAREEAEAAAAAAAANETNAATTGKDAGADAAANDATIRACLPKGIVVEDGIPMTAALSAWLKGSFPEPTTITGVALGPSLAFLTAPSPVALQQCLGAIGNGGGVASVTPAPQLCSICQLPSKYRCPKCRVARYCSIECGDIHEDMRCNKFVA